MLCVTCSTDYVRGALGNATEEVTSARPRLDVSMRWIRRGRSESARVAATTTPRRRAAETEHHPPGL
jgi:hypothetical protein